MAEESLLELDTLLVEAKKVVETSATEERYRHNLKIYERLLKTVEEMPPGSTEDDFVAKILDDYELYCVVFVRLDNGLPMFPAPWQSQWTRLVEEHDDNFMLASRKIGKSGWQTSYYAWKMHRAKETITHYAPTEEQLFSMADLFKMVGRNRYLMRKCVGLKEGRGEKGKHTQDVIEYALNGSVIRATNLAIGSATEEKMGATKRGGKGTIFGVDEIGLIPKKIRDDVIDPMMADVYTQKKMVKMGTPETAYNPDLKREWDTAEEMDGIGNLAVDVWRAKREGCIGSEYIANKIFRKLGIPCPWGTFKGTCGRRDFQDGAIESPEFKFDDGESWVCDECCMRNPTFVREFMASFPERAGRFFTLEALQRCVVGNWRWSEKAEPGRHYIAAIDVGLLYNNAQIGIFEVNGSTLRLVRLETHSPRAMGEGEKQSYVPLRRRLKSLYLDYQFKTLYVDTTGNIEFTSSLTKPEPVENDGDKVFNVTTPPIPPLVIFSNDTAKNKDVLGVIQSGEYKSWEMNNYREVMEEGRLQIPSQEPFLGNFMQEHESLVVKEAAGSRKYLTFKEPKGGSMDLVDMFGLACIEVSKERMAVLPAFMGNLYTTARGKVVEGGSSRKPRKRFKY